MTYELERRQFQVIAAVEEELRSARIKFPIWWPRLVEGASTAMEEAGETTKAVNDYSLHHKGSIDEIRAEAVQAAAMYIRFLVESEELWHGGI